MNLATLDQYFQTSSEMEVARLLTCNFNLATFGLIQHVIPDPVVRNAIEKSIKFRNHLSLEVTSLDAFIFKFEELDRNSHIGYTGKANKICGYSGKILTESKTLLGKGVELVSHNEATYVVKLYPWWIKTVNPQFQESVDLLGEKTAFICRHDFDLEVLRGKEDVESVSEKQIKLFGGTTLDIIKVDH